MKSDRETYYRYWPEGTQRGSTASVRISLSDAVKQELQRNPSLTDIEAMQAFFDRTEAWRERRTESVW